MSRHSDGRSKWDRMMNDAWSPKLIDRIGLTHMNYQGNALCGDPEANPTVPEWEMVTCENCRAAAMTFAFAEKLKEKLGGVG